MKHVQIEHLAKRYGALHALDDVCLRVEAGELFFLLGPSGCGKTTLLRAIAGFVQPDAGRIFIGDRDVARVPPQDRHTGMVFQSYALWPHMTALENVAFGLRAARRPRAEALSRAREALALTRMADQATRKPSQMSGGQQQRVALARALVIRPACLLLDEPLSNLDAKLREEMREEIRRIAKESGLTAIYVTHDQKEALSTADRIAVMRDGKIVQVGRPDELYRSPCSVFVADFLGRANFIPARALGAEDGRPVFDTPLGRWTGAREAPALGGEVMLMARPESIRRADGAASGANNVFVAPVDRATYLGETIQCRIRIDLPGIDTLESLELNRGQTAPGMQEPICWRVDPEGLIALPEE